MDAFAVAILASAMLERITRRHLFRLAFHFGLFQALMPVLGWAAGRSLISVVQEWDHWVAFGLLLLIGSRAILCSFQGEQGAEETDSSRGDPTRGLSLVALSVATSIDALAVGVTFAVLGVRILVPVLIIGLVATTLTTAGMLLGRKLGRGFGKKAELLGGIILVVIGIQILLRDLLGG